LLRALLGLLPADSGEIRWNGIPLTDPAAQLTPPRAAYVPQVPRLFSDSLRENVLLGQPEDRADLPAALEIAALAPDLATMPAAWIRSSARAACASPAGRSSGSARRGCSRGGPNCWS
jgi:ATP-binding cassette subfamily B protein